MILSRFAWLVAAAGLPGVVALAAGQAPVAPTTHTLFMGTDIDLQQNKEYYRVQDVSGGSFVIKIAGKEKAVPMKFSSTNLKVANQLKLSETSVNVDKLVVERAYTPGNDPNRKFIASLAAAGAAAQLGNDAATMVADMKAASDQRNGIGEGGPGPKVDYQAQSAASMRTFNSSAAAMGSDMNNAGISGGRLAQELGEEMYDAIEITFEVSSQKPLGSPYAVVVAQFSDRGAKASEVQNWIFATELDPITPEVRRVRIKQGGFPPGFALKNHQLHLYNRGQEVATTVASKRVELTKEEAFDYVLVDYLASNKGQTTPATLAMGRLPASVRNNLQLPALFVKVSKDGLPVAAFADETCTRPVDDPALVAALEGLRFKPALDKGKAVPAVARVTL